MSIKTFESYTESARLAFINYHKRKAFLSFHYGIYSYLKYFGYKISRNDVALFNLFLRYTVHDYEGALKLRHSFNNRKIDHSILSQIDELIGDIEQKIKQKNEIIQGVLKKKNILFIFGESEDERVLSWQKGLYDLAFECGIKELSWESKDDYFKSESTNHNMIRMDTINFKNADDLLEHIPSPLDLIFIVSHSDLEEIPGFKMRFGNVFPPSKHTVVDMNSFCRILKSKINNDDCVLICFSCGSKGIKASGFKNVVRCNEVLTFAPLISYSFSFLSSFIFESNFDIIHKRAKLITKLYSKSYEAILD